MPLSHDVAAATGLTALGDLVNTPYIGVALDIDPLMPLPLKKDGSTFPPGYAATTKGLQAVPMLGYT